MFGYVYDVVSRYSETEFRRMFRMSPATLDSICNSIENLPELQKHVRGGKERVPVRDSC